MEEKEAKNEEHAAARGAKEEDKRWRKGEK